MSKKSEDIVVTEQDEREAEEAMNVLETNRKFVEEKLRDATRMARVMKDWLRGKWVTDPEGFRKRFFGNQTLDITKREVLLAMTKTVRKRYELFVAEKVFCQNLLDNDTYAFFDDLSTSKAQVEFGSRVLAVKQALFMY